MRCRLSWTRSTGSRTSSRPGRPPDGHFPTGTDRSDQVCSRQPSRMARPAQYEFVIGELRKNAAERLRVSVHEFNGHVCSRCASMSARTWARPSPTQTVLNPRSRSWMPLKTLGMRWRASGPSENRENPSWPLALHRPERGFTKGCVSKPEPQGACWWATRSVSAYIVATCSDGEFDGTPLGCHTVRRCGRIHAVD